MHPRQPAPDATGGRLLENFEFEEQRGGTLIRRAPFEGYKQSGNGRESGPEGLEEFLETKAVLGYSEAA